MDNHQSHTDYKVVKFAKDNGIALLTFPPHCSYLSILIMTGSNHIPVAEFLSKKLLVFAESISCRKLMLKILLLDLRIQGYTLLIEVSFLNHVTLQLVSLTDQVMADLVV
jgi:hypothetical protein